MACWEVQKQCFSTSLTSLSPNTKQESCMSKSQSTACGMSLTYERQMSGPKIEPCGAPQDNSPGDKVSLPMFT